MKYIIGILIIGIILVALTMAPAVPLVNTPQLKYVTPDNFGAIPNDLTSDLKEIELCVQYAKLHGITCRILRGHYISENKMNYGNTTRIIDLDQKLNQTK